MEDTDIDGIPCKLSIKFNLNINYNTINAWLQICINSLFEKWSNVKTIFMDSLILDIFSVCALLSVFLQSKSLNYMQVWLMITTLKIKF